MTPESWLDPEAAALQVVGVMASAADECVRGAFEERDLSVGRVPGVEDARDGSLAGMFDHVGIAVADLAASERFYRTVLSALGVEPSHADAGLVEWEDWAIGPTDPEHPVTRGLSNRDRNAPITNRKLDQ